MVSELSDIGIKDAEMAISSVDGSQPVDQCIYFDNISWLTHVKDIDRWYFGCRFHSTRRDSSRVSG